MAVLAANGIVWVSFGATAVRARYVKLFFSRVERREAKGKVSHDECIHTRPPPPPAEQEASAEIASVSNLPHTRAPALDRLCAHHDASRYLPTR